MNIFILEYQYDIILGDRIDWVKCASSLDNRRVVKMYLETLQILSTAVSYTPEYDGIPSVLYKPTHRNHPCCVWARECQQNFQCLLMYALALRAEYVRRFKKGHKGDIVLLKLLNDGYTFPNPGIRSTLPPLAVSEEFRRPCTRVTSLVNAYREYYCDKNEIYYFEEDIPNWFKEGRRKPYKVFMNNKWQTVTPN